MEYSTKYVRTWRVAPLNSIFEFLGQFTSGCLHQFKKKKKKKKKKTLVDNIETVHKTCSV